MVYVFEYVSFNYLSLMMLGGMGVMFFANRRLHIAGTERFRLLMGIVFLLTVLGYLEKWCDTYHKPLWILYFKACVSYALYPLLIILELFLITRFRRKLLLLIPYLLELPVLAADLFGANLVYGYFDDHSFNSGRFNFLPAAVLCWYIVLLFVTSLRSLREKEYAKALVAGFVAFSATLTTLLEILDIVTGLTIEISALGLMVYYFYFAAIYHGEVERELNIKKTQLLISQIQPHFIRNSMAVIRSLCYESPQQAVTVIDEFSLYLDRVMKLTVDIELVPLEREMEFVDNYLFLEQYGSSVKLNVVKKLENHSFGVPPLSVQPVVENALKHAFDRSQTQRTVVISSFEDGENYYVTVEDNGKGFNLVKLEHLDGNHIGLQNVRDRLSTAVNGTVSIESAVGSGTKVTLTIPKAKGDTK